MFSPSIDASECFLLVDSRTRPTVRFSPKHLLGLSPTELFRIVLTDLMRPVSDVTLSKGGAYLTEDSLCSLCSFHTLQGESLSTT